MRQVVWNIATNGLRAMPHGGQLTLGTRWERGDDGARHAILEVADRGVGMSPEQLEGIFQPVDGP